MDKWVKVPSGEEVKPGDKLDDDAQIKPIFKEIGSRTITFSSGDTYEVSGKTKYELTPDNKLDLEDVQKNLIVTPKAGYVYTNKLCLNGEPIDANTVFESSATVVPETKDLFAYEGNTITGYSEWYKNQSEFLMTDVIIPSMHEGVAIKNVGANAFYQDDKIENLVFEDGIESIGDYAFYESSKLKTFELPNTLKTVKMQAFRRCDNLIGPLVMPDTIEELGEYAFSSNKNLEGDLSHLPSSLKKVGDYVFWYSEKLTGDVFIPNTLPLADDGTPVWGLFSNTGITSLTYDDAIEFTGNSIASGCENLATINLPKNLKTIGFSAFSWCDSLESIDLPEGLEQMEDVVFNYSVIKKITVPSTCTEIGQIAKYCPNLVEITIPDGCRIRTYKRGDMVDGKFVVDTSVGDSKATADMFAFCESLQKIKIGEGTTELGSNMFRECTSIREIELPSTIRYAETSSESGLYYDLFEDVDGATVIVHDERWLNQVTDGHFRGGSNMNVIYKP